MRQQSMKGEVWRGEGRNKMISAESEVANDR